MSDTTAKSQPQRAQTRACSECGEGFTAKKPTHVFCSAKCRTAHWHRTNAQGMEARITGARRNKKGASATVQFQGAEAEWLMKQHLGTIVRVQTVEDGE